MRALVGAESVACDIFGGKVSAGTVLKYARFKLIPSIRVHGRGPVLFDLEAVLAALLSRSDKVNRSYLSGEQP
jgi:hypothetical protein